MTPGRPVGSSRPASPLARARVEAGLTQMDLVDALRLCEVGAHQSQVSAWERGIYRPQEAQMDALAKVLHVSRAKVDEMFPMRASARGHK